MKIYALALSFFLCLSGICHIPLNAAIVIKNGKIHDADFVATLPVQRHYALGVEAMNCKEWHEAILQFKIVTLNFPASSFAADSHYYLAFSYLNVSELDLANQEFSQYLNSQNHPKFFEKTIEYKFVIAEHFKNGAKRRFFGWKVFPRWASAKDVALTIYDEVIASLPCHDLAARALFSKGNLLWEMDEYRESIECFQMFVKRFPKHELAPECYLAVTKVYLEQSEYEFQNPDLLILAQLNVRRFTQDFPREERLQEAEDNVAQIKEIYARGLYDTGLFYERIKKPQASIIYYQNAMTQFPDTKIALLCEKRLNFLCKYRPSSI